MDETGMQEAEILSCRIFTDILKTSFPFNEVK